MRDFTMFGSFLVTCLACRYLWDSFYSGSVLPLFLLSIFQQLELRSQNYSDDLFFFPWRDGLYILL